MIDKLKEAIKAVTVILYRDEINHIEDEIKSLKEKKYKILLIDSKGMGDEFMPFDLDESIGSLKIKPWFILNGNIKSYSQDEIDHAAQLLAQQMGGPIKYEKVVKNIPGTYLYGLE
jgi:hypothetical protein